MVVISLNAVIYRLFKSSIVFFCSSDRSNALIFSLIRSSTVTAFVTVSYIDGSASCSTTTRTFFAPAESSARIMSAIQTDMSSDFLTTKST